MNELEAALAQLFRKKGKSSLTESEFVFAASLDLRWYKPKDAQRFLEIGLDSELLVMDGEHVSPAFDYKNIEIPRGYAPTPELLQAAVKPKGLFLKLVDRISVERDIPGKDIISEINHTQDRMGIDAEVAALIVADTHGIDISEYLDRVEEDLGKRYRKA